MPRYMTNDVKQFRWREALVVLSDTSKAIKEIREDCEITCCVHATQNGYYVSEYRGYDNWDMVGACPYFDVFSTTIVNWALPEDFYREITRRTVAIADRIAAWTYRGGYGTVVGAPDALALWDRIGANYRRVLSS